MDNLTPVKISALPAVASPSTSSKIPLVDSDNITKYATIADLLAIFSSSGSWSSNALPAVSSVTALGNRSYNITFSSTVAAILTPGMRLRTSRSTAAPTQCTDLESGSSQYYSRTSAGLTGMTFTDDFVVSAWVKLESYAAMTIASRYNGTSGWDFQLLSDGRLYLAGYNGGAANVSNVISYQSVPLNKWVHVAVQLDMSTFTATTTTSYVMIDGAGVPAQVTRGGTNPTALIQAGNLEIGGRNGGLQPFDGKLAQVAIYNAKVTQATILASMHQTLTGSETSLASAYSFNNSVSDLNANANNLTANNSAVATNADSPFTLDANGVPGGTYDFGIVTKVAATVATVQVPEGCAIPTTGGVSAVDLSPYKAPFGMTVDEGRWAVVYYARFAFSKTSPSAGTYYSGASANGEWAASFPIGAWKLAFEFALQAINSTNAPAVQMALSTSNSGISDTEMSVRGVTAVTGASSFDIIATRSRYVEHAAATVYYMVIASLNASAASVSLANSNTAGFVRAELAYL